MNVIVLDTETTNSLDDPICYDIGWIVVNTDNGEILSSRSFAIAEVFLDAELMSSAYFFDKIPSYWEEIQNGTRKLVRLVTAKMILRLDCAKYGVEQIFAHNARFDWLSCNLTERVTTCSKYRYFFPYGVEVCDTLAMSRKAFGKDKDYCDFCEANNYKTVKGAKRFTAEIINRFLTGDNEFEEVHKGLDDVMIEKDILLACLARGVDPISLR